MLHRVVQDFTEGRTERHNRESKPLCACGQLHHTGAALLALGSALTFPVPHVVQAGQGDPSGHQSHLGPADACVAVLQGPQLLSPPVREVRGLGRPRRRRVGQHVQLRHPEGQRLLALVSLKLGAQRRPQQRGRGGKVTAWPTNVCVPGHHAGICHWGSDLLHGAGVGWLYKVQGGLGLQGVNKNIV